VAQPIAQQTETLARPVARVTRGAWRRHLAGQEGFLIGAVSVTLFLLFWEGVGRSWTYFGWQLPFASALPQVNPMFTSSPSRIVQAADKLFFNPGISAVFAGLAAGDLGAAWTAIAKGSIWKDIAVSATELAWGYGLALAFGITFGLLCGWFRRVNYIFQPFVSALYATPGVALLPLYIIWFGIGINSKIAVIFMSAVFYPLIYALEGVKTADPNLLKAARSFGANDFQLLRTVILPGSVPFLFTGARLAIGRALVGVVVGELYAATAGVGYLITVAGATFQTDKVFVGVLIVTFCGVLLTVLLQRIEERFSTWRPRLGEEGAGA
jgi:ABC-type nitrate/sulfonate/bicarbonate transport system permease component